MPTLISEKMGIKAGMRVLAIDVPAEALAAVTLPAVTLATEPSDTFDHILVCVTTQTALEAAFARLRPYMKAGGKLWAAWPKGGKLGTDLNIKEVIRIGYNHGLVESTNLRIDDTWTALKFTRPKPGKIYNNSYGTLATRNHREA
jgi:hypothetical protein